MRTQTTTYLYVGRVFPVCTIYIYVYKYTCMHINTTHLPHFKFESRRRPAHVCTMYVYVTYIQHLYDQCVGSFVRFAVTRHRNVANKMYLYT